MIADKTGQSNEQRKLNQINMQIKVYLTVLQSLWKLHIISAAIY